MPDNISGDNQGFRSRVLKLVYGSDPIGNHYFIRDAAVARAHRYLNFA